MTIHQFGGDWTTTKLERVKSYLEAYLTIFHANPSAQFLTTVYVDAFAGTGTRVNSQIPESNWSLLEEAPDADKTAFLQGSASIALNLNPSFDRYLFLEANTSFAKELETLKINFPDKAHKIQIENVEANSYLQQWCKRTNWRNTRAVVFLDPYGTQVAWETLRIISQTKSIDLWLLFPLSGVNRMLIRDKKPPKEWGDRLTRLFGNNDWEQIFYSTEIQETLFGSIESTAKNVGFDQIGEYFINRLKTIFPVVAPRPLTLYNSHNSPLYWLCFASSNPKPSIKAAALRIAKHILET